MVQPIQFNETGQQSISNILKSLIADLNEIKPNLNKLAFKTEGDAMFEAYELTVKLVTEVWREFEKILEDPSFATLKASRSLFHHEINNYFHKRLHSLFLRWKTPEEIVAAEELEKERLDKGTLHSNIHLNKSDRPFHRVQRAFIFKEIERIIESAIKFLNLIIEISENKLTLVDPEKARRSIEMFGLGNKSEMYISKEGENVPVPVEFLIFIRTLLDNISQYAKENDIEAYYTEIYSYINRDKELVVEVWDGLTSEWPEIVKKHVEEGMIEGEEVTNDTTKTDENGSRIVAFRIVKMKGRVELVSDLQGRRKCYRMIVPLNQTS